MGALDGLRVLDFTTLLPGPYATLTLADLGAEVLRIVRPGSYDLVTHWGEEIEPAGVTGPAAWLGRGKRSVYLDLKQEKAVEAVKGLVGEYDILVEQFRPGVMDRLGIGYGALRAVNPGIIYCAITGYGQTGPLRHRAGHDCNYLARSGILSAAGRREGGPALYNVQIADVAAGANNAVIAILAAVYHRQRTGEGQYIDIAMADGVIPFHSMDGAAYLAGGQEPKREGQLLNGGGIYDYYETADGRYMSVGSLEPKFFAALCRGLGFPAWQDGACLRRDTAAVKAAFQERFRTKTQAEWTAVFRELDACVEPVCTIEEALADEQLRVREMWPQVPFAHSVGSVRQPGCPIKLSATPVDYRHAGYPEGYHTAAVLRELGYTDREVETLSGGLVRPDGETR